MIHTQADKTSYIALKCWQKRLTFHNNFAVLVAKKEEAISVFCVALYLCRIAFLSTRQNSFNSGTDIVLVCECL